MSEELIIKKYFMAANSIVINQMYLNSYKNDEIFMEDLKEYNPGHLGSSMSINFIMANLNYFLNKNNLTSQLIIGTGHSGVSLITNLWLNGTLTKYYPIYSRDIDGLNRLINDFGKTIRSEINIQYPGVVYEGGELGYSLGVSYGYALTCKSDIVPCIIGDGEAETGTLCSAWQLNKMIKTKSKVLPILNLNGLKMGSNTFLSLFKNEELIKYFHLLGYNVMIVDASSLSQIEAIKQMQKNLKECLTLSNPLIIFKSPKGYTLPNVGTKKFEGNTTVHKNPLNNLNKAEKLDILKIFLHSYKTQIFDNNSKIISLFDKFKSKSIHTPIKKVQKPNYSSNKLLTNIQNIEEYIYKFVSKNNCLIFSPDEIYSNGFKKVSSKTIEILNENLLQAVYQGYIQAGNIGLFIGYEGFMPILSSMITQYYKYLKQKETIKFAPAKNSLNYILTSTCFENTYSHQNPDIVNTLLEKNDKYYNVYFPKDASSTIECLENAFETKDQINLIITSKRHAKTYNSTKTKEKWLETIIDCNNPELILAVTGDYMLDRAFEIYEKLKYKIKIVYITKPQLLKTDSISSLDDEKISHYFNKNVPIIYLFSGYASTIKSLLFDRKMECSVYGYTDEISTTGRLENNFISNNLSLENISKICKNKILRREYEK